MTHSPTPEQLAILSAARDTTAHLMISARAGAAKTSTLILLANELRTPITCLAFNKMIATELTERLPSHATASTMHSIGMRSWQTFSRRCKLDNRKKYRLADAWIKDNISSAEQDNWFQDLPDLLKGLSLAQAATWRPEAYSTQMHGTSDEDLLADSCDLELSADHLRFFNDVATAAIRECYSGIIDFDDMVYMPVMVRSCSLPKAAVLFVDEAQDLSMLNHLMLSQMVGKSGRLIAVGDPFQAIYAFRGADTNSMKTLAETFEFTQYKLTTTFRCAQLIVKEAQSRAKDLVAFASSPEGQVLSPDNWSLDTLPIGAAVICRNNAPLFKLAIKLLKTRRSFELYGNDLIGRMEKTFIKFGSSDMLIDEVYIAIDLWHDEQKRKKPNASWIADWRDAMLIIAKDKQNLAEVIRACQQLAAAKGDTKLMTGHKSKGLEFDSVYLLDTHLLDPRQEQDRNLKYVMQTRARTTLVYVNSDTLLS